MAKKITARIKQDDRSTLWTPGVVATLTVLALELSFSADQWPYVTLLLWHATTPTNLTEGVVPFPNGGSRHVTCYNPQLLTSLSPCRTLWEASWQTKRHVGTHLVNHLHLHWKHSRWRQVNSHSPWKSSEPLGDRWSSAAAGDAGGWFYRLLVGRGKVQLTETPLRRAEVPRKSQEEKWSHSVPAVRRSAWAGLRVWEQPLLLSLAHDGPPQTQFGFSFQFSSATLSMVYLKNHTFQISLKISLKNSSAIRRII